MKHVWLGECNITDYPVVVITKSQNEAKKLLVAEHRRIHANDGYAAKNWRDLCEKTEVSLRSIPLGHVVWP